MNGGKVFFAMVFLAAAGVGLWKFIQQEEAGIRLETTGLNVPRPLPLPPPPDPSPEPAPPSPPSWARIPSRPTTLPQPPGPPKPRPPAKEVARIEAGGDFIRMARRSERKYDNLAREYTKRYKVVRAYGKEWMGYPDLKKLNDEYFVHHDPVRFAFGVASSPNFPKLVAKYAAYPEMQAFIRDSFGNAPKGLLEALSSYLNKDANAQKLMERFVQSSGMPKELVSGLITGSAGLQSPPRSRRGRR